jgi:hypothetical protein
LKAIFLKKVGVQAMCSLICGQASDLASSVTMELPHEAKTYIWAECHVLDLNYKFVEDVSDNYIVSKFRGLQAFPEFTGGQSWRVSEEDL